MFPLSIKLEVSHPGVPTVDYIMHCGTMYTHSRLCVAIVKFASGDRFTKFNARHILSLYGITW